MADSNTQPQWTWERGADRQPSGQRMRVDTGQGIVFEGDVRAIGRATDDGGMR